MYFPAVFSDENLEVQEEEANLPMSNGELVLLVDDEAAIREITKEALESSGYRVLTAIDGTEAVAQFAQRKDEIDVVLTDMVIPIVDGRATIRALRKINPNLRVIAASGHSSHQYVESLVLDAIVFLHKPYTASTLLKALAEALATPQLLKRRNKDQSSPAFSLFLRQCGQSPWVNSMLALSSINVSKSFHSPLPGATPESSRIFRHWAHMARNCS